MKKNVAITIISILAVAAIALGVLYFTNDADKTKQIDGLIADVSDRDSQIQSLSSDIKDRDGQIVGLNADITEKAGQIETLEADVAEKDSQIEKLDTEVADKSGQIEALNKDVAEKKGRIEALNADIAKKTGQIETLNADVADKARQIETLSAEIIDKTSQIEGLKADVDTKDKKIAALEKDLDDKVSLIEKLNTDSIEKAGEIDKLQSEISAGQKEKEELTAKIEEDKKTIEGLQNSLKTKETQQAATAKDEPGGNTISSDVAVGDIVTIGHYEQDNQTSNGKESIEWIVLAKEENKCLLLSKYALDVLKYNRGVQWINTDIRKWLNNEFLNEAFTEDEIKKIYDTVLDNGIGKKGAEFGVVIQEAGENTVDKVFLIRNDEAEYYFPKQEDRRCEPTEYVKNNGIKLEKGEYYCTWWTREPLSYYNYNSAEFFTGFVTETGQTYMTTQIDMFRGVRPAIWVDLSFFQPKKNVDEVSKEQVVGAERHPIIKDEADLLTESEEKSLENELLPLCEYYTPVFWTTDAKDPRSTHTKTKELVRKIADSQECIVFTIDMYTRRIAIYSTTSPHEILTSEEADRIMEDVYLFASGREYYQCAEQAFEEILQLFEKTKQ